MEWVFRYRHARNMVRWRSTRGGKIKVEVVAKGLTLPLVGIENTLMAKVQNWIALGVLVAAPAFYVSALHAQETAPPAAPAAAPHHKSHKAPKAQKPVELPPLPGGPLSQLPMDQIPTTPAKVSFQGGLLSISAQNSTLGEILRQVRQLTGASIEIPQGSAANERVVTSLGPGAPRDVLVGLLNGSSFNYVMLGSSSDPTAVSSVILTTKTASPGETQTASAVPYQNSPEPVAQPAGPPVPPSARPMSPNPIFNRGQVTQPPRQPGNGQAAAEDDSKDDDQDAADEADDQPQSAQPDMNGGSANANVQEQPQAADPNQPNAGPKTPEQILDMLRRQQPPGGPVTAPQQPPQPPQ
jgi:hypothetical protein